MTKISCKWTLPAVALTVLLSGCLEPEVEPTRQADAQALADSLVYVKAKNGLCFGVGTTSRVSSNASVAMNNVMVAVDCEKVVLTPVSQQPKKAVN